MRHVRQMRHSRQGRYVRQVRYVRAEIDSKIFFFLLFCYFNEIAFIFKTTLNSGKQQSLQSRQYVYTVPYHLCNRVQRRVRRTCSGRVWRRNPDSKCRGCLSGLTCKVQQQQCDVQSIIIDIFSVICKHQI